MANGLPDANEYEELRRRVTLVERNLNEITTTISKMKSDQEDTIRVQSVRHQENRKDTKEIKRLVEETLSQTKATNGRVTELEKWKAVAMALKDAAHPWYMAIVGIGGSVISGVVLWLLLRGAASH